MCLASMRSLVSLLIFAPIVHAQSAPRADFNSAFAANFVPAVPFVFHLDNSCPTPQAGGVPERSTS
jgi:hypothetical protein